MSCFSLYSKSLSSFSKTEITLKMGKLIGQASFGKIYQSEIRGTQCAIKVPRRRKYDEEVHSSFKEEARIMRFVLFNNYYLFCSFNLTSISKLCHPNIVLFMGAYISKKRVMLGKLINLLLKFVSLINQCLRSHRINGRKRGRTSA